MKMNKKAAGILLAAMSTMIFTGCGSSESEKKADNAAAGSKIVVISREDGSGTRGAFIELFGIEKKDADGKKIDHTTDNAAITNNTSVMMTTVAGNKDAIGYISLGSLNDSVKALKIDGAEASAANVKSGAYKIARPFNICTKDGLSEVAQDFVAFIMSKEGQEVVAKAGCIGDDKAAPYKGTKPAGKVVVAGSSSITPAMEKLKEAYMKINPAANIEIQSSDSTTGVKSAVSGICDIGMASRDLKKSELEQGLKATVIATDGIAVIVNKDNKYSFSTISDKTSDTYGNATIVKNDDVYIIYYSNIEEYKNAPDEKSDPKTTKPTETKPSTDNTTQHIKTDINGLLKNTKYTDDILKLQNSDSTKTISIALTGVKPGTRIEVFDHLFNQTVERDHDEFEMPCDYTSF